MSEKKQRLRRISKRERRGAVALMDANERLRKELLHTERECYELREANINICLERDVTDELLGVVLDQLRGDDPPKVRK